MCYLLYAQKLNKNAKKGLIQNIITSRMAFNKDGFGVLDANGNLTRSLDVDEYKKGLTKGLAASWLITHLRMATQGHITLTNVHLFELDGFYFAHNGIINDFHDGGLTSTKSDSLLYFEALIKSIKCLDKNHIAKRIKKSKFFDGGRAILKTPDGQLYFFGDFHAYKKDGWLLISSSSLEFKNKAKEFSFGHLKMTKDDDFKTTFDGIFKLNPSTKSFDKLGQLPKKSFSYNWNDYPKYKIDGQIGFDY